MSEDDANRSAPDPNSMVRSRLYWAVAILALIVIAAILIVLVFRRSNAVESAGTYAVLGTPVVSFIGDSYTGGSDMGGGGDRNYTKILGSKYGWHVVNTAVGGTGYVHAGPGRAPFEAAQLAKALRERPNLLVVEGSRNDEYNDPSAVRLAADRLIGDVRAQSPATKILIVGPIWSAEPPTKGVLAARDAVRYAASDNHVPFIDPIEERWLSGGPPGTIGTDMVHPTDAGHLRMATLLEADMARFALIPISGVRQ